MGLRLGIAVLVLLLFVTSVFAIWPVVADAPWEDSTSLPVIAAPKEPSQCEVLTQQLADAQTDIAASIIAATMRTRGCR